MGRKRTNLEDRIIQSASNLFYTNGFSNTGIALIIEKANTNKTSFYQYFKSKDELGHKYIWLFNKKIIHNVIRLMRKSQSTEDFIKRWLNMLKRSVKNKKLLNGCPVANYYSQLEIEKIKDKEYVHYLSHNWIKILTKYFSMQKKANKLKSKKSSESLAKQFFIIYQGLLNTYKLTQDITIFDESYDLFMNCLEN
ncbi:MAG: TetR/AcrR family transcriptional regulator [Spirochaetia bacterium]|nr:TetR/AcrR family transcriptional regulator [Spirochaetia bacterium]